MSTTIDVDSAPMREFVTNFYNGVCNDAVDAMIDEWRSDPDVPRDTGAMTANLRYEITEDNGDTLERLIVAPEEYSSYQEEGTGIYGPLGERIYPTHAKVLVFYWKKTGRVMFLPSVAGAPKTEWFSKVRDRWAEFVERIAR